MSGKNYSVEPQAQIIKSGMRKELVEISFCISKGNEITNLMAIQYSMKKKTKIKCKDPGVDKSWQGWNRVMTSEWEVR